MATKATWNGIEWVVSPEGVQSLQDISTSYELEDDGSALKAQTVTLKTTYLRSQHDPDLAGLLSLWRSQIGAVDVFRIGDYEIGPAMKLLKVEPSDFVINEFGTILKFTLSITLTEPRESNEESVSSDDEEEYYDDSYEYSDEEYYDEEYYEAIDVGPSEEEKEEYKDEGWGEPDPYEGRPEWVVSD